MPGGRKSCRQFAASIAIVSAFAEERVWVQGSRSPVCGLHGPFQLKFHRLSLCPLGAGATCTRYHVRNGLKEARPQPVLMSSSRGLDLQGPANGGDAPPLDPNPGTSRGPGRESQAHLLHHEGCTTHSPENDFDSIEPRADAQE